MAELNGELSGANHGAEGANGNPPADPTVTGDGLGLDNKDLKYCTMIMRIMKKLDK